MKITLLAILALTTLGFLCYWPQDAIAFLLAKAAAIGCAYLFYVLHQAWSDDGAVHEFENWQKEQDYEYE